MDVALIGCGFIGSLIAEHISSENSAVNLKIILDRNPDKVERIQHMFSEAPAAVKSIEDVLSSNVSLVIEAASIEAVHSFALPIISSGKEMMIMSVGAFSKPGFYDEVKNICLEKNQKVYLPSGALGGLDAISSASVGKLEEASLKTTKNPRSLEGAPYIVEHAIDLSKFKEPKVIFSGNAAEAIKGFPANVNVAIALSLAGLGVRKTKVSIVADPNVSVNIHEVTARGDFGKLKFRAENLPAPDNPRTSLLAAFSAISTLKRIVNPIKIG
jgi:aspartate dehydrogenase